MGIREYKEDLKIYDLVEIMGTSKHRGKKAVVMADGKYDNPPTNDVLVKMEDEEVAIFNYKVLRML